MRFMNSSLWWMAIQQLWGFRRSHITAVLLWNASQSLHRTCFAASFTEKYGTAMSTLQPSSKGKTARCRQVQIYCCSLPLELKRVADYTDRKQLFITVLNNWIVVLHHLSCVAVHFTVFTLCASLIPDWFPGVPCTHFFDLVIVLYALFL